jgi:hypothetical protein
MPQIRLAHRGHVSPRRFSAAPRLTRLLALYGALIAIAARGAGKRYGPALGVLVVCISVAHTAAAMLLTLSRYYG